MVLARAKRVPRLAEIVLQKEGSGHMNFASTIIGAVEWWGVSHYRLNETFTDSWASPHKTAVCRFLVRQNDAFLTIGLKPFFRARNGTGSQSSESRKICVKSVR
jgi:hypothetical protein